MSQQVLEPPPSIASLDNLANQLQRLVAANRRRWKTIFLLEAVGLVVAASLAYLWIVFFLDNQWHLPMAGRLLASLGFLAGAAWLIVRLVRRWRDFHPSEDRVALAMEQRTPGGVQNRLINAVQLARDANPDSLPLREAVVQENCLRLRQSHLHQAASDRPALIRLAAALAMIAVGLGFWLLLPAYFSNAAARIFLPLAQIDPLYRTKLRVEPGNIEAAGEVILTIAIDGERPETLTIIKRQSGKTTTERVQVLPGTEPVRHTFRDFSIGFDYTVRGGDYTSETYRVTVPAKAALLRARADYQYPAYTRLQPATVETAGDLEALAGSRARATFYFDQPVDQVNLVLDRPSAKGKPETIALTRLNQGKEFTTDLLIDDVLGYRLEMTLGDRPVQRTSSFAIRVLKDQNPKVDLMGLDRRMEILPDTSAPLQVAASDDFGLIKVGLFYRKVVSPDKAGTEADWKEIQVWPGEEKTNLTLNLTLNAATLQAAEGDKIELAARAVDNDPLKAGAWITGAIYELAVGGDGVALQFQYEQILRSEKELASLMKSEEEALGKILGWMKQLDGEGNLRWDDPKNVDRLHGGLRQINQEQEKIRQNAAKTARTMNLQAGNLRIAVSLLADSEMMRVERILDSVAGRDRPEAKRAALADARVTLDRILRSLRDLQDQYAGFRLDWELINMIPFTKMLADRQVKLRDQSKQYAAQMPGQAEALHQQSMHRRQTKMIDLVHLIQPAFVNLGGRLMEQESILAKAFAGGAATLRGEELQEPLRLAAAKAKAGDWPGAALQQTAAAEILARLHGQLRQAQQTAMQKALLALKDRAKSDLKAQQEIEKLKPGSNENYVKDYPDHFKVEDLMRFWEVAGARRKNPDGKDDDLAKEPDLLHVDPKQITLDKDSGVRQDPYTLKLGNVPEKTPKLKMYDAKDKNKVQSFIQEKFDDLVGKLLDEADELAKDYQSINLSTNQNNNDPGEISKVGGALNSTGAVTATGNKKPPTTESGGVSKTGRQGARAYGMIADEDTVNRKGRDQALEGQQEVADQAGKNKMASAGEDQKDTSTGVGGKKIASDDTHFSLHDSGKWKDDYGKRLEKPQKKAYIVERQDGKIDAKTALMLRDLTSKQEQIIERLKAIRKELKNLYLPTEHLDDLAAALESNLDQLKDRPEAELFRMQEQSLDRLRGALRVFAAASANFQPSLPRDRQVRGRILDDPNRPALPGYEEATKQYYLRLATQ